MGPLLQHIWGTSCGQRCHPGDWLLEGPPPSSPPPLLLFLFCSPVLVIENVFIAGPEAGLGRGRRCSLWRYGWGEGRRVWLLFSTTNSLTQSFFFSPSSFWLFSLFTDPSHTPNFSLFARLFFQCLPVTFILLSLYRSWLGMYNVRFKCKWRGLNWSRVLARAISSKKNVGERCPLTCFFL